MANILILLLGLMNAGAPQAFAQQISTPTAQIYLGTSLPLERGPWVLGEILFLSSGRLAGDPAWRDKVRGSRGSLYTRADVLADVDSLMSLKAFQKVEPALYEIAGSPVPPEFYSIAGSTSQVRLVFNVTEKAVAASSSTVKRVIPPAAVSGVVLTPTAYRGAGRYTTPGLGFDVNAAYIIGRLYGRNSFPNATRKVNYIDRVGLWMLSADGKMQLQSESSYRPAFSVGGVGTFLFRDTPQPRIDDPNTTLTVNSTQKSTKLLSAAYVVGSKKFGPVRTSVGFMQGNQGDMIAYFSEFLTPDALGFFAGKRGQTVRSRSVPFASFLMLPKPEFPLAVEFMKFNGAALNPVVINFKVGYFLHLNFEVGYLKFQGGYDVLGLIQFRYNQFPQH